MKQYKGYLIDLDGTMYKGADEIDGAKQFIDYLNQHDIPHLYVTNNSTKVPEDVVKKLAGFGIEAKPEEVVTSALATAHYIKQENAQASIYVIGEGGLRQALLNQGLTLIDDTHVDYVVVGLDTKVDYDKFSQGTLGVRNGAKFISTNQDISIPNERGFLPGNGAITSVITTSTKVQPTFIGKPQPIIMDMAMDVINLPKEEVAMVGDLYETDIMSGINAGIDTIHVQTGVTSKEELAEKDQQPTYTFKDLNEVIKDLEG
ncbi:MULTISPECIES: TIGR01457 family HAD-type hydrolase [Staphylococcus]|uniref:Acid sugar phosphatase n=1 Tax=Staphylococcus simulans UMC-CNS-990 TaxID=1405498 RepID=A0ABP2YT12_STASI|nr:MULTISPECIES: TIGR01457 family HAD-type hydrolase [Staphylococcus]AVO02756.1 HAD family hydrolase [Staphylococcus simulans]AVO05702.1 HAD family hydrolase [Staphylococcus simulans]AWG19304.1 HAD family hydrolase [Staphylococcus simulans]AWI02253.1 HAD family hydrolase [Staphylococcus simulans]ERS92655.1 HAD family hydrolase [Staphylococcus simulans UMC-CNS-990]